jgi:hypothetical protein
MLLFDGQSGSGRAAPCFDEPKRLMQAARPKLTSKIMMQLPHVLVGVGKEGLQKLVQLVKKTPEQNK